MRGMNPNFEHPSFEKELKGFSKEMAEHQAKNEIEKIQESHIREVLKAKYAPNISVQTNVSAKNSVLSEEQSLPDYMAEESPEIKQKVERLVELAFEEGLDKSSRAAAKMGPFILDAFHDAITSKLYAELKKRNLLK